MPGRPPADEGIREPDRIPARNDSDARKRYLTFLNRSLSTVHPSACWRVAPVPRMGGHWSALTVPAVIDLTCEDDRKLYLQPLQRFTYGDHPRYPRERKVNTREYAYILATDPALARTMYSWEWNPASEVWPDPHLHVLRGEADAHGLGRLHTPTGRVAFEAILKFAILQLGARTVGDRDEALAILDGNFERFSRYKTW